MGVNEDLKSLKGDLRRIYNQVSATNKYVTSEMVKMTYTAKGREKRTIMTLGHDVPLEKVSKLLDHRSIKTTQIYAKVSLKKLSNNMEELRGRLLRKGNENLE